MGRHLTSFGSFADAQKTLCELNVKNLHFINTHVDQKYTNYQSHIHKGDHMGKILVNFLTNPENLARFDHTCKAIGRTRTSVLTQLMDQFSISQISEINAKNSTLREIDEALLVHRRLTNQHEEKIRQHRSIPLETNKYPDTERYDEPVGIMYSNGEEFF